MKKLVLASQSPRRQELLSWVYPNFSAHPANIDESQREGEPPADYVKRLACEKAGAVYFDGWGQDLVLGADTIVVLDGEVLGKPSTRAEALSMLNGLRGREHQVMTALAVFVPGVDAPLMDLCESTVPMRDYTRLEMLSYIQTGDPYDKAGGYAIQNESFHPVQTFHGCFASVMGLPLCHLARTLQQAGVILETNMPSICQHNLHYTCFISERVLRGDQAG